MLKPVHCDADLATFGGSSPFDIGTSQKLQD
jgi:hypothetical protein